MNKHKCAFCGQKVPKHSPDGRYQLTTGQPIHGRCAAGYFAVHAPHATLWQRVFAKIRGVK